MTYLPLPMAAYREYILSPSNGYVPVSMFHSVTPAAHTSTLNPWNTSAPLASSGGWNAGVPELLVHSSPFWNLQTRARRQRDQRRDIWE